MPIGLTMAVGLEIWFLNIHISKWIFLSGRVESELHQAIQEAEKELIKVLDINTFHTSFPDIFTMTINLWFLTTALHIRINMFTYANINFRSKLVYFTDWTFEDMRYKIDTFWWSMKWGKSRWHIVTWVVSIPRRERRKGRYWCWVSYCSAVSLHKGIFE